MSLGSFKINKVEIPDSLDTVCNIIENIVQESINKLAVIDFIIRQAVSKLHENLDIKQIAAEIAEVILFTEAFSVSLPLYQNTPIVSSAYLRIKSCLIDIVSYLLEYLDKSHYRSSFLENNKVVSVFDLTTLEIIHE